MSRFDQPSSDDTRAEDFPDDMCPVCHNDVGNCACPDPEVCIYCSRLLPDMEFHPYCNLTCSLDSERYAAAHSDPRRI